MRTFILYGIAVIVGLFMYFVVRGLLGVEAMMIVVLIGLAAAGVIIVRNLMTNRKTTEAAPEQRKEALAFAPVAGKAALYLFRNQFVGRAVGINVLIDGREVAQLKSPRFTRILLAPGPHRISGYTGTNKAPGQAEGLAFTASAGEVLVMKCEVEPQVIGVTVKYTPLNLDAARGDVQKIARMVVADVAEV